MEKFHFKDFTKITEHTRVNIGASCYMTWCILKEDGGEFRFKILEVHPASKTRDLIP